MDKVKLPREVAEALEKAKNFSSNIDFIAWKIPRMGNSGGYWETLCDFSCMKGNFLKLIDALRYGYEIEEEPITVTVTGEKISQLKAAIQERYQSPKLNASNQFWIRGALDALNILDLKIPGVNA